MGTLSNNTKVGDKGKDLILQTSGRVYVQVRDRFYEVPFRGDDKEEEKEEEENPLVIFINSEKDLEDYPYPGDGFLIITADGKFFQTTGNVFNAIPLSAVSSTKFSEALTIDTITAPFIITSTQLVKNLNAELLNSIPASKFARKDIAENISGKWAFNSFTVNKLSDSNAYTLLDLESGVLSINTINANKINITTNPEESPDADATNSSIDILNKPTYFGSGFKVLKASLIDKVDNYSENNSVWYSNNENAEVGGYSISDLISAAYDNDLLDTSNSLFYYYNLLTTAYKYDAPSNSWKSYILQSSDFEYVDDKRPIYLSLKFRPKDRSIYKTVEYGIQDDCATHIYDRWFDISNYVGEIKDKYQGLTFECSSDINQLNSGIELYGIGSKGLVEGLVVGGTENKLRIIVSGTDCDFLYMKDDSSDVDEKIKACKEGQIAEKGKTISADIEMGNVLFDGDSNNIIGDITDVENSVFGTLSGFGLSSEGNCYFVNPGIAITTEASLPYIKLSNQETSFIGLNSDGTPWINIEPNGSCIINGKTYTINSNGTLVLGPITISETGSATIGSGEYQITIDESGQVKIPSKCIV